MTRFSIPTFVFAGASVLLTLAARALRDMVIAFMTPVLRLAQPPAGVVVHPPVVQLVAARAFVARWVRREVPRMQAQWRMCPSV